MWYLMVGMVVGQSRKIAAKVFNPQCALVYSGKIRTVVDDNWSQWQLLRCQRFALTEVTLLFL